MRVFKTCLLIMRRHKGVFLVYFGVFMGLAITMSAFSVQNFSTDFEAVRPTFAILNRDVDTPLTEGFADYLEEYGEAVTLQDEKEALQDASFFHAAESILILPAGFSEALREGAEARVQTVSRPDTAAAYYLHSLAEQYWNTVRRYQTALPDMTEGETAEAVLCDLSESVPVEKKLYIESQPLPELYEVYNRMLAYILLVLLIICTSTIFMNFKRPDLKMRNLCSPMKPREMSAQLGLYGGVIALFVWVLMNGLGLLYCASSLQGVSPGVIGLVLLNNLVFLAVALSISMVASTFIRGANMQNVVSNFLSLAVCFLGGVFVPLEMFGSQLLAVARFMPTYWYVSALDKIGSLTALDRTALRPVFADMLVQLGFAAALICVFLAVSRYQGRSERAFGSVRTETEA